MVSRSVVVCLAFLAAVSATDVNQCQGDTLEDLRQRVRLSPCKRSPCKLKRGTNQNITIDFTPESEMEDVKNQVNALIVGVPLPFVGVDGNSICDKVYTTSGEKASCPLSAGTTYTYKDSFPILSFYPTLELKVHWELKGKHEQRLICFEVPAKIV